MDTNEPQPQGVPTPQPESPDQTQLKLLGDAQEYFGMAHDYIAQAQYPGHLGGKIAGVMNFLKFQHDAIKQRMDDLKAKIANEEKAKASVVDVAAAKAATEASLSDEHGSAVK